MKRPKPFSIGKVRVRIHSGPREDGRWRWRADRQDGARRAHVWGGWGTPEEAERAVIEALAERGERTAEPTDVRTVGDLLSTWLGDIEPHDRSTATTTARRGCADRLSEAPIASVQLARLDRRALDAYVRGYQGAASTLRTDLITLRAAWRWGRERELVPDRELPRVVVRRGEPVLNRYTPTPEQVAGVLERLKLRKTRPPGWPWRAVYLLFATGCRPGEIATLIWENVDLERRVIHVTGKTGRRTVPLHPVVAAEVANWEHRGATVAGCKPPSVLGHLHNLVFRACTETNCPQWSLYGLRRAAVIRLYGAGVDPSVAAAVLGHSPETALRHYRQIADADLAEAVRRTGLGLLPEPRQDAQVIDLSNHLSKPR